VNAGNSETSFSLENNNSKAYQKYILDEINYTIVLTGSENNGEYSLIEMVFPAEKEKEMPSHKHTKEDLIVYIIEGTFLIKYGDKEINGKPGMVLKFKKNIYHSYKKIGNNKGKFLILFTPAGLENYFRDIYSSFKNDSRVLDKDDDRITLHLLEKNYGWNFNMEDK
jgi:quercetin dioxygenase-like cupin family protein